MTSFTSLELCAGAGGTAVGIEQAGFRHVGLLEIDTHACATLRKNRPNWNVIEGDIAKFSGRPFEGVDLLSAGVPCPPFSKAGLQLGKDDERDLFPQALRLVREVAPRAVMFENVRGLMDAVFDDYRKYIDRRLHSLGYFAQWKLLNASDYGVPQLRPRTICVALRKDAVMHFSWPTRREGDSVTVGTALLSEMQSAGWKGAATWAKKAGRIGPTIVGGSKKHGGPDLGPTRARKEWEKLGVNPHTIAEEAPSRGYRGMPRLTVRMAALLQGFPTEWEFVGKKTPAYRQVGNAFPPPVAAAVASAVRRALEAADSSKDAELTKTGTA